MGTLVAMRYCKKIKEFSERLKAAKKPAKVVIVACMRKLLVILNAVAKTGAKFQLAEA
jgi:transposase